MEASGGGAMREAEPGLQGGVCSGRWNVRRGHARRGDVGRGGTVPGVDAAAGR